MKIVPKTLQSINGKVETATNGDIIITIPKYDLKGYEVIRADISGLKPTATTNAVVMVEDRSDDEAKLEVLLSQIIAIQMKLVDENITETSKALLYAEFANLSEQVKTLTGYAITEFI
ncbi:hypothetical protein HNP86_001879 [Methanococcus maripaludis]|uniref:Uncharacterized protein n=1 Tax=Methanococcus maripaludis TaxID=39152 RepID=A0A7J9NVL7_METMI|nr:hypothetical protein [Methanococcus maripaludis]MBA2851720.1 hypothetical protein [Methanococcus maripaludis]